MEKIELGKLLISGKTQWPEAFEYNYTRNGHVIRIFLRSPTKEEIKSIREGVLDFALYTHGLPVMLFKSEALPWSDCPFSYWLVPTNYRQTPPDINAGEMAIINIILIDSDTGIVKAIRSTTLSTEFSQKLHRSIQEQIKAKEFTPSEFSKRASKIQKYQPVELVEKATVKFSNREAGKSKGFGFS